MPELVKKTAVGAAIGLVTGLLIAWGTNIEGFFLDSLLDGYEYRSYDARMQAKAFASSGVYDVTVYQVDSTVVPPETTDVTDQYEEEDLSGYLYADSIYNSDVIIVDIDQLSIEVLGNYLDWPHAHHGELIDAISSGNAKAILFDIIFDPENSSNFQMVNQLLQGNEPSDEYLLEETKQYLIDHDTLRFIRSTAENSNVYHSLVFEQGQGGIEVGSAFAGDSSHLILGISPKTALRLPGSDRLGNTHLELLAGAKGLGAANFPQDKDGLIRRAPTALHLRRPKYELVWHQVDTMSVPWDTTILDTEMSFEVLPDPTGYPVFNPDYPEGFFLIKQMSKSEVVYVYPSLTMSAAMDILDVPQKGLEYDFDAGILRLSNSADMVIREIPIDEQGRMYVNYYGTFKTFKYYPYVGAKDPWNSEYFKDKAVIVGASLPGLMDLRNTPVQETFPGVEIHTNVLHSLLEGEFVARTDRDTNFWALVIMCIVLGVLVALPPKPLWSLPFPLIAIGAWILFAYSQFLNHLLMWEIVRPSISLGVTYLGFFLYNFLVAEKDKRFLKNTFGTYISPELIDQMYKEKQEPQLGGEEGHHTAFFTDIQSFSTFSEKLSAADLVELLNSYLTEMTDILLANKGTLDKYIGDAIVAFYGAPAPVENHEYYACLTAVKMQDRLAELRQEWESQGDRWPEIVHHMQNRIGINTGSMVTGNMGSSMRMNYTMMGDTVNLAARLEASAKQYGIYIQVAAETQKACSDKYIWRDLDYVIVMGKTEPAKVYELIAEVGNMPDGYEKLLTAYDEALSLYRNQKWEEAVEAFRTSDELEDMFPGRKTNPSRIYIPRCEHYRDNPPGDDWDGSWALTKK